MANSPVNTVTKYYWSATDQKFVEQSIDSTVLSNSCKLVRKVSYNYFDRNNWGHRTSQNNSDEVVDFKYDSYDRLIFQQSYRWNFSKNQWANDGSATTIPTMRFQYEGEATRPAHTRRYEFILGTDDTVANYITDYTYYRDSIIAMELFVPSAVTSRQSTVINSNGDTMSITYSSYSGGKWNIGLTWTREYDSINNRIREYYPGGYIVYTYNGTKITSATQYSLNSTTQKYDVSSKITYLYTGEYLTDSLHKTSSSSTPAKTSFHYNADGKIDTIKKYGVGVSPGEYFLSGYTAINYFENSKLKSSQTTYNLDGNGKLMVPHEKTVYAYASCQEMNTSTKQVQKLKASIRSKISVSINGRRLNGGSGKAPFSVQLSNTRDSYISNIYH